MRLTDSGRLPTGYLSAAALTASDLSNLKRLKGQICISNNSHL